MQWEDVAESVISYERTVLNLTSQLAYQILKGRGKTLLSRILYILIQNLHSCRCSSLY